MSGHITRRLAITMAVLAVLAFGGLAACGDDDDGGGGVETYCELSAELQGVEDPSDEQLEEIVSASPEEIRDQAEVLADALREGDDSAFEDPEVIEAVTDLQEFEAENCGGDSTDST